MRLLGPNCGRPRVFREEDLFERDFPRYTSRAGDVAVVTKARSDCGTEQPLRIRKPPELA